VWKLSERVGEVELVGWAKQTKQNKTKQNKNNHGKQNSFSFSFKQQCYTIVIESIIFLESHFFRNEFEPKRHRERGEIRAFLHQKNKTKTKTLVIFFSAFNTPTQKFRMNKHSIGSSLPSPSLSLSPLSAAISEHQTQKRHKRKITKRIYIYIGKIKTNK